MGKGTLVPHLIQDPKVREQLHLEARRVAQEAWDEAQELNKRITEQLEAKLK
jgi:hypothetical protein